jgi:hypothetical protein
MANKFIDYMELTELTMKEEEFLPRPKKNCLKIGDVDKYLNKK